MVRSSFRTYRSTWTFPPVHKEYTVRSSFRTYRSTWTLPPVHKEYTVRSNAPPGHCLRCTRDKRFYLNSGNTAPRGHYLRCTTWFDLSSGHTASDISSGTQGICGSILVKDVSLHSDITSGTQGVRGSILVPDVAAKYAAPLGHIILIPNQQMFSYFLRSLEKKHILILE